MIKKGEELNYANKNLSIILQGSPGVGKSTLAQSAPKVLTIDTDNGMCRVKPQHRKDTSVCSTFDEVRADINSAKGQYETVVIDTGGALIEMMKQHIVDHPAEYKGGAKNTGGISLQGFGFVKQLWNEFTADLRRNFNLVIIFHESSEKNGDDGTFYQIVCEGSTRNTVYQSADLAARIFISNGQRYAGFTPTESYSAKSCFGISGLIPIPELKDGDPNDFLTKLFAKVRENLAAESASLAPEKEAYEKAMETITKVIADIKTPENVVSTLQLIKTMKHGLTSEKEAKAMLKKKMDELGIGYDKESKTYVWKNQAD